MMNETAVSGHKKPLSLLPARFFSVIFHPLFIGLYVVAYFIFLQPDQFIGISQQGKIQILLIYLVNAVFFPVLSVLLCKGLGFIHSIVNQSQKDRIIVYSITMVFFFWTFYVFRNKAGVPFILTQFSLGVFLSVIAAFIANIYFKISMHAVAVGGMVGIFVVQLYTSPTLAVHLALPISVLIAGITCTSRLAASNHTTIDITWGLILGFICQWLAYWFL